MLTKFSSRPISTLLSFSNSQDRAHVVTEHDDVHDVHHDEINVLNPSVAVPQPYLTLVMLQPFDRQILPILIAPVTYGAILQEISNKTTHK